MIAICLLAALKQVGGAETMGVLLAGCRLRVTPISSLATQVSRALAL